MAHYGITLEDGSVIAVTDVDTYAQEGPLTTFFRTRDGRPVVDSWSERIASFRTATVLRVQRVEGIEAELAAELHRVAPAA